MIEKLRQKHAAQFAGPAMIGAGVVDGFRFGARSNKDHGMPWRRLAELPVEEQVAGQGRVYVAAHKIRVSFDKRPGIGELRKCSVGCVLRLKWSRPDSKKPRSQRRVRITPRSNLAGRCGDLDPGGLEPSFVVMLKSFAIGITKQACTVCDFSRHLGGRTKRLIFRNERKPAAEGSLVGWIGEPKKIGRPIAESVAPGK